MRANKTSVISIAVLGVLVSCHSPPPIGFDPQRLSNDRLYRIDGTYADREAFRTVTPPLRSLWHLITGDNPPTSTPNDRIETQIQTHPSCGITVTLLVNGTSVQTRELGFHLHDGYLVSPTRWGTGNSHVVFFSLIETRAAIGLDPDGDLEAFGWSGGTVFLGPLLLGSADSGGTLYGPYKRVRPTTIRTAYP